MVLDKLTYAGNLANLEGLREDSRLEFVHGDIAIRSDVEGSMAGCTHVVNFAAETHVDRSILDASDFLRTDVEGTRVLLEVAREVGVERYLQVSTDEVYGDVSPPSRSAEKDALRPRSPYSASKAAGDLMVHAYQATFGLPTVITRGANTYGPYQYPEKLIPLFVTNALDGLPLPVYGDGLQVRDWLFVEDHCNGIATVLERGREGETYNLGMGVERPNLEIIERIVELTNCSQELIRFVPDRPGHDRRYALDTHKAHDLGWTAEVGLEDGLQRTVEWYRNRRDWWEPLKAEGFQEYYRKQYGGRLATRPRDPGCDG